MAPLLLIAVMASSVPSYDVEKGCKAESAVSQDNSAYEGCVNDELAAKEKVTKEWGRYSAAARQDCTAGQSGDLTNSYVELMTCFEMQDWKKSLGSDGDLTGTGAASAEGGSPPLPSQMGASGSMRPLGGRPGAHVP
jgi:hypothetical protein